MRKQVAGFMIVMGFFLLTAQVNAQTYDLSDYFLTTNGAYKTTLETSTCQGGTWDSGTTALDYGRYLLQTEYDIEGGNWIEKEIAIFEVTSTALRYYGNYDPDSLVLWRLQPPVVIPRSAAINQPISNSGVITNGLVSSPYVHNIMIVEAGVSVTTAGGAFNGCLKVQISEMSGAASSSSSEIWAPSVGMVKRGRATVDGAGLFPIMDTTETELTEYWIP